jgi:hypothetical protein
MDTASRSRSCNDAAICGFRAFANVVPRGAASCNQVASLQTNCHGNQQCENNAVAYLAPARAHALALYDGCVLLCMSTTRNVAGCVNTTCAGARRQCLAQ